MTRLRSCSPSAIWATAGGYPAGPALLRELEVRAVHRAVLQLYDQRAAAVRPARVRLPDVRVLIGAGVVAQAAVARRERRLDAVSGRIGITRDLLRLREAGCEDVEPLVAVEAELDRDRAARVHGVE